MAKNVTSKDLSKAVKMRLDGKSHAYVLEHFSTESGEKLSHSQFEFAWLRLATLEQGGMKELVGSEPATNASVVKLRKAGESWGRIAVLIDKPEATARKLFAESGTRSEGIRIGKGGRWLYNDQDLYNDGLEASGTEIPVGTSHEGARAEAANQKMIHMGVEELRALATKYGVASTGTPAAIVKRIRKAMAEPKAPAKKAVAKKSAPKKVAAKALPEGSTEE